MATHEVITLLERRGILTGREEQRSEAKAFRTGCPGRQSCGAGSGRAP